MINIVDKSGWADTYDECVISTGWDDGTICKILEMKDYYMVYDAGYETWIQLTNEILSQTGLFGTKQDTLVTGVNIKLLNGTDLLGAGEAEISGREIEIIDNVIESLDAVSSTEFTVDSSIEFYYITCINNDIIANFDLNTFGARSIKFIRTDDTAFKFYINDLSGTFTVSGEAVPFDTNGYYTLQVVSDGSNLFIY